MQYGYDGPEAFADGLIPGRVVELRRESWTVLCEQGEVQAQPRGALLHGAGWGELPCVGDFVLLRFNPSGPSLIHKLLPRRSKFWRREAGPRGIAFEQLVAANFDTVFVVSSLNQDFNPARILRYLSQARMSGAEPVVLLTKADLCENWAERLEKVRAACQGVAAIALSVKTGLNMHELAPYLLPGKTLVFLGMSGVGKSSLLNALMGREVMGTAGIREDDSRGRHTTTHRQLFLLPSGVMVIDTPGMRELGLLDAEEGVSGTFAGIEALFERCRFADCSHKGEPGCAVRQALASGELDERSWQAYLKLRREVGFAEDKNAFLGEKRKRNKEIAAFNKRRKKGGGKP
ncbi:MAG: ribosome small subunit-dependent GTPase A [Christensenellaceae bacterium]|jgi:ribosome biogenesis GTPase|nr:ribosome small subunit-dependent GTPase A [Christensenellaceae bacterium]